MMDTRQDGQGPQDSDAVGQHAVLPAVSKCLQEMLAIVESKERRVGCKADAVSAQAAIDAQDKPAQPPPYDTLITEPSGRRCISPGVAQCLQDILATIDAGVGPASTATVSTATVSAAAVFMETTSPMVLHCQGDGEPARPGDVGGCRASPEPEAGRRPPDGTDFGRFLPHEGARWTGLRDKALTLPQFQQYAKRVGEGSPWSLDEAFLSFCLDRLEESLMLALPVTMSTNPKPVLAPKIKKTTRRKGQPRKYERAPDDNIPSPPLPVEEIADAFYLDEVFEEEDVLSMDDNPSDLDYEPVSIIRYKKKPSRKLPQRSSTRRSRSDAAPMVVTETGNDDEEDEYEGDGRKPSGIVEVKPKARKKSGSPRATPTAPKGPAKTAPGQPPRKRGRPRKNPADPPKVRGRKGRPPLTEEQRVAKRKAYNDSRTRTRLEVIRDALPKILRCKDCPEQFTDTEAMLVHHLEVHQQHPVTAADRQDPAGLFAKAQVREVATVLLECPKCGEYAENLTRHDRAHQTRDFVCEECGKVFVTRMRLKLHTRVHDMDRSGERLHCDRCDKSYRCLSSLQRHQLVHAGQKTFICDQCGKGFYNGVRLRVHRAVHLKEKPYPCPDCGRGFTQLTNLRSHQRVHTGAKPYACQHCPASFTHKVSLKMHQKKRHGIDWWKENGIQVEERRSARKKKRAAAAAASASVTTAAAAAAQTTHNTKEAPARQWAFPEPPPQHPASAEEGVRNYDFVSNLITHGSKTYAQLERKSSLAEAFHTVMNPFEGQWHT